MLYIYYKTETVGDSPLSSEILLPEAWQHGLLISMTFILLSLSKIIIKKKKKRISLLEKKRILRLRLWALLCLPIYSHNYRRQYQEGPKWIIWVQYIVLLLPIIQQQV